MAIRKYTIYFKNNYNMYDSKNVARGMKSTFMLFSQSEAYFNSLTTYHLTLYISISFYLSLV